MLIKQIVIEGVEGDLVIRHTGRGAVVMANDVEVEVSPDDSREERFSIAFNAAKIVYGTNKRDEPKATNSMIHDVLNEIERVAGC